MVLSVLLNCWRSRRSHGCNKRPRDTARLPAVAAGPTVAQSSVLPADSVNRRLPIFASCQIWLALPLQDHRITGAPNAADPLLTSRHRLLALLRIVFRPAPPTAPSILATLQAVACDSWTPKEQPRVLRMHLGIPGMLPGADAREANSGASRATENTCVSIKFPNCPTNGSRNEPEAARWRG
jgi:hypothetical protein